MFLVGGFTAHAYCVVSQLLSSIPATQSSGLVAPSCITLILGDKDME